MYQRATRGEKIERDFVMYAWLFGNRRDMRVSIDKDLRSEDQTLSTPNTSIKTLSTFEF